MSASKQNSARSGSLGMYSVLLLEDEVPTRRELVSIIEQHPNLQLAGEAGSCAQARELLGKGGFQVLLTDLGLPDGSGIDIVREAQQLYPDSEVLVLTAFGDEESVIQALEAGATGYLLKDKVFDELGEAIISLMQGESTISPKVARFLLKRFKGGPDPISIPLKKEGAAGEDTTHQLTERECEVLNLIAKGYSYNEIGASLSLSTNTIRAHIRNIYRKLAVKSRSEAVFEAAQLGLIQFEGGH